jgi:two-component system, sensor histidine kinase RpfC
MTHDLANPARTVLVVEDAHKILEADGPVCAVVTDVHLPEASGLDLIQWVRARKGHAMPIVVISGDTDPDTPAASLRLGANAYFSKPFSPNEVREKLEELIHAESSAPPVR